MFVDRLDSNEFERFVDNGTTLMISKQIFFFCVCLVVSVTVDRLGDAKEQVNNRFLKPTNQIKFNLGS
jgi:hypothetical protein